jgi:hypothetical protein
MQASDCTLPIRNSESDGVEQPTLPLLQNSMANPVPGYQNSGIFDYNNLKLL